MMEYNHSLKYKIIITKEFDFSGKFIPIGFKWSSSEFDEVNMMVEAGYAEWYKEPAQEEKITNADEDMFRRFDDTAEATDKIITNKFKKQFHNKLDKDFVYDFWNADTIEKRATVILMKFPLYYAKSKIWYSYLRNEHKWIICDENDIISSIKLFFEPKGYSKPQIRSELLNALQDQSRINKPKELSPDWLHFGKTLYNIKTKEKKDICSDNFSLIKIPHHLGESTETPIIDKKIISWVGKDKYKLFVQICAYSMLKAYPFARFFIFYGTGQDGKSTAGNFITNLIGGENACDIDLDQLNTNRFESQKLYQKTLAVCGEVDYKLMKNTRRLKGVTGNDSMTIEFKNKNPFSYKNFAKLLWYANGLPPTYDKTQGFYRRTIILKFPTKFSENVDPLGDITEIEYENFCLKCTEYLEVLLKEGFDEKSLEDKQKEYEELSNPVLKFFDENVIEAETVDLLLIGDLYNEYNSYAKKNAYRPFNYKEFLAMIKNLDNIIVETKKVYISEETGICVYDALDKIQTETYIRRAKSFIENHKLKTPCPTCPTCPINIGSASSKRKLSGNTLSTLDKLDSLPPIKPSSLNPIIKTFIFDNDKGEGVHFDEICKAFDKNEARKSLNYMYAYGGVVTVGKDKYKLGDK